MRLNKTESPSFVLLCFLQRQPFRFLFYLTAASLKCHVAAVRRLPALHRSKDYIFIFFEITKPIFSSSVFEENDEVLS